MPPKKTGKEEVIDIASLPPWFAINCVIKFEGKKQRYDSLFDKLKNQPKSFQKFVSRDDILNFAKEKGLYADPNADNKKGAKKDAKGGPEVATEVTPDLLASSFFAYLQETDLQGRKDKKDKQDQVDAPVESKDPKKAEPQKKDAKKGAKVEEVKEEVHEAPKIPEKEYKKACDVIYVLGDFPQSKEDVEALSHQKVQVDLIVYIKQKVLAGSGDHDMSLLDAKDNFDEDYKARMDEFIEGGGQEEDFEDPQQQERQEAIQRKNREAFSEEDLQLVHTSQSFLSSFKAARNQSSRTSSLRQVVLKELAYEVDPSQEEESLKVLIDTLFEEICGFSFDIPIYQEWAKQKQIKPLLKSQAVQQQAQIKEEVVVAVVQEVVDDKAKGGKKDAKKDTKGKEDEKAKAEELERLRLEEEERQRKLLEEKQKEEEAKKTAKEPFFTYNKQLSTLGLESTGSGILLECLLDQLSSESEQPGGDPQQNPKLVEEQQSVTSILDQLEGFIQFKANNALQNFQTSEGTQKVIIDEVDEIRIRALNQRLFDNSLVGEREGKIVNKLNFPGIDRYNMPEVATKSDAIRKAEKCSQYPFITCSVQEFERRYVVSRFEQILKDSEPEREWNFSDRIYLERHNRNTVTQTLYKALLFDPTVVTNYNVRDDNLYIALYFKNPPGRILRQKWSAEWKVLPNLENWINFFKNSDNNLRNEQFYDIDYQEIGNLHERVKLMFPTDNSVMMASKYQVGDQQFYNYKVLKEGVQFGIRNNLESQTQLWCNFDSSTRFLTEYSQKSGAEGKSSFTITLQNGLLLKFLPNTDVYQQLLKNKPRRQEREFEDIVNPFNNANANDNEINRIITGKGSVVKYLKDGSTMIYYANGNTSFSKNQNSPWVTTNNKGLRKLRSKVDGTEQEIDAIPCARRTDPQMGSKITIRGDQTLIVSYKDGSQYVKYKDGTEFFTNTDKTKIVIEHPDYATVEVLFDKVKMRTDTVIGLGAAPSVGHDNLFERSNDGRIVRTILPDGTKVMSYKEKRELSTGYQEYVSNIVNLVYFEDGSVAKVVDNGEVIFVSAVDRYALNQKGENRVENDIDFWIQMYTIPEERKAGVFTCNLADQTLWSRDDQGNYFALRADGEVDVKIAVSLNLEQQQQQDQNPYGERPGTPEIPDGDFIEEENKFLPQPESWVPPRLFVIGNDNTAQELLNEGQLNNYFRLQSKNTDCIQLVDENLPNYEKCDSISFITFQKNLTQKKVKLINPVLPRNLDIIPATEKKRDVDTQEICLFRNLLKFSEFNQPNKDKYKQDLNKWENWQKDQLKQQQDFGLLQRDKDAKTQEFEIYLKILQNRNNQYREQSYDQTKYAIQQILLNNSDLLFSLLEENKSFREGDQHQFSNVVNIGDKNRRRQSLAISLSVLPQLTQNRLESMQIHDNSVVQDDHVKQKSQHQSNSFKQVDRWMDSLKLGAKSGQFVRNYFETLEGLVAIDELIRTKQIDLNGAQQYKLKQLQKQQERLNTHESQKPAEALHSRQSPMHKSLEPNPESVNENNTKNQPQQKTIMLAPSIFTKRDYEDEQRVIKEAQEAEQIRLIRTKNYNVYGQPRKENETTKVPCLLKTQPKSELNQKSILQESLTDNRLKISSMHQRVYLKAPSINEIRNTGSHTALQKTIDKRNSLDEVEGKKNLMITADLNDNLKKNLLINPISARFGLLKQGCIYELNITIKNEDVLAQRVVIKQPQTKYVRVFMREMGPIALGLQRSITVRVEASPEIFGRFQDQFQIISKHDIYTIPIHASILDADEFDRIDLESKELNQKSVLKPHVHQLKFQNEHSVQLESNNSDLLPKINNFDKNYKIDPYSSFGKKKKNTEDDSFEGSYPH